MFVYKNCTRSVFEREPNANRTPRTHSSTSGPVFSKVTEPNLMSSSAFADFAVEPDETRLCHHYPGRVKGFVASTCEEPVSRQRRQWGVRALTSRKDYED